jgi:hypothetical protein
MSTRAQCELYTLDEAADYLRYRGRDRQRSVRRLFQRHRIPLLRRDRGTFLVSAQQPAALLEADEMLTIRKRGRLYHVRGSVRLGGETRRVKEHSTGCDRREDAEAYRARLEHDVRQAMLHDAGGTAQGLTIADAGLLYMNRPGGLKSYDLWRLDQLNDVVGDYPVAKAAEGIRRTSAWSASIVGIVM